MRARRGWTASLIGLAAALACTGSARAATTGFFTSFEAAQPQPTWTDTAERSANVDGRMTLTTIPGNITDEVVDVQANSDNPPNETKEKAVDGNLQTKWLTFNPTGWLQVKLSKAEKVVDYALTSANDSPGRDPQDWTLQGSNDGSNWTTLDTQTGQSFSDRFQTKEYAIGNDTAYLYYRLNVTRNHGDDIVQLAELQLSTNPTPPPTPPNMRSFVDRGPTNGPNIKANAGWTGLHALHFAGGHVADGPAFSYNKVLAVDVKVTRSTRLSYLLFPELTGGDLQYPSTYSAVDLAFSDGTYLSQLHAQDQEFADLSPRGQGLSKNLYANQWNFKESDIGAVAAGKTIKRILIGYDNPGGHADTRFNGWVDDIRITTQRPPRPTHLADWAITTRGTNSSGSFSRGNNFPATAVPHGFNFWTPMTSAGSMDWLYEYQAQNDANNLPELQAFAASHEPSPWMGDRQTFQVMPSTAAGTPNADRSARALPFSHDDEIAHPYYYGVTFMNGLKTEIAPTDHAAEFRFTFPGSDANLIFDNVDDNSSLTIDRAHGTISGTADDFSGGSNGAVRMYVYATFSRPMTASGMVTAGNRPSTGYAKFAVGSDHRLVMRIATSLISVDQARHNLGLEVAGRSFGAVKAAARRQWDRKLGAITVQGANDDQLTTLYSNLYRLNLYPNSAFENRGSAARPEYVHAVQSSADTPGPGDVKPGRVYVNNGFWDTYRTAWPAYSLLYSRDAGRLVDGFLTQYRDGGWVARWSSPGYANLMTGTSSDVAFADAFVKGIKGFDPVTAYDAALKNATVAPPGDDPFDTNVGRKGLVESEFLGYTPNEVGEGLSWSLEGFINDFGISNMAARLAHDTRLSRAQRQRYLDEYVYFRNRAQDYVHLFDSRVGFFQGKSADGTWTTPPDQFDPRVWRQNGDYTETDGWNFAFHAPQDGRGLANLYGGRAKLAAKLDRFFSTPETAQFPGTYGSPIHEMLEARDVRMGQWGASNQVSHHIPYMYDFAGQPYKAQALVREATRRLFTGSQIGEGYPGDEDNGEMSAWYIFSALGFYPLEAGSSTYAIGSPLFDRAVVHLQNGRRLVIDAPNNSPHNVYIQRMRVNGRTQWNSYIRQRDIADGGRIEFDMGPRPSRWATGPNNAPPSITRGSAVPHPLEDAARQDQGVPAGSADAPALFDNDSRTEATLTGTAPWVGFAFDAPRRIAYYTLTSAKAAGADPSDWVVKASNDGKTWSILDRHRGETFPWRDQTRPFALHRQGDFRFYRIEFTKPGPVALAEVELLSKRPIPANPISADVPTTTARAGTTASVPVTVRNAGTTPVSGQVSGVSPDGWSVTPASAPVGPIAAGGAQTVALDVAVPAGTAPGTHQLRITASTPRGTARVTATIEVIGSTIEFSPGTDAETPWLVDPDGSQLDGDTLDGQGHGRFADNGSHFTYRFALPSDVTGGTLTLMIGNEYLVDVSTDGTTWHTVAQESRQIHDLSNRNNPPLKFDLNALRGSARTLYVRIGDSKPDDGWGGWLDHLKLELTP
jgi:predicted alpha-1,2-mannosidase